MRPRRSIAPSTGAKLPADRARWPSGAGAAVRADGREFGFDLEHALGHGTPFLVEKTSITTCSGKPEEVLEIPVATSRAGRARGVEPLGNLHFPRAGPGRSAVRVADDPAVLTIPFAGGHLHYHHVDLRFLPLPLALMPGIIMPDRARQTRGWRGCCRSTTRPFPPEATRIRTASSRSSTFGLVHRSGIAAGHIENHLWPMLVHFELPVVRFAQEAARKGTIYPRCSNSTPTASMPPNRPRIARSQPRDGPPAPARLPRSQPSAHPDDLSGGGGRPRPRASRRRLTAAAWPRCLSGAADLLGLPEPQRALPRRAQAPAHWPGQPPSAS